jgi:hypothetical protein
VRQTGKGNLNQKSKLKSNTKEKEKKTHTVYVPQKCFLTLVQEMNLRFDHQFDGEKCFEAPSIPAQTSGEPSIMIKAFEGFEVSVLQNNKNTYNHKATRKPMSKRNKKILRLPESSSENTSVSDTGNL